MNELQDFQPASRTWRDISQQVKPRAMSREGRRRYFVGGARTTAAITLVALLGAGVLWLAQTWSSNPAWFSAASGQPAIRKLVLETNGRLDQAWVRAALALPAKITLMEVDIAQLRNRLEQHRQIEFATVSKVFPDALSIQLTERMPLVRLRLGNGETRLVGRDGVVFPGEGFAVEAVGKFPVLLGFEAGADGAVPARISGLGPVADLIARARELTPWLFETWQEIDISRLGLDGLIEVHAADVPQIVFGPEDFSSQLTRLSQVLALPTGPMRLVDVSLGPRVTAEPALPEPAAPAGRRTPAAPPAAVSSATPKPLFQLNFDR